MPKIFENIVEIQPVKTPVHGAMELRKAIRQAVNGIESNLKTIRSIVAIHSRSSLAAELGDNAQDFLKIYNALKAVLEIPEIAKTLPPLP